MTSSVIASAVRPEVASPSESLPPPEKGESPLRKKRKQDTVRIWPEPETHGGLIYKALDKCDSDDNGATSVASCDAATSHHNIDGHLCIFNKLFFFCFRLYLAGTIHA